MFQYKTTEAAEGCVARPSKGPPKAERRSAKVDAGRGPSVRLSARPPALARRDGRGTYPELGRTVAVGISGDGASMCSKESNLRFSEKCNSAEAEAVPWTVSRMTRVKVDKVVAIT